MAVCITYLLSAHMELRSITTNLSDHARLGSNGAAVALASSKLATSHAPSDAWEYSYGWTSKRKRLNAFHCKWYGETCRFSIHSSIVFRICKSLLLTKNTSALQWSNNSSNRLQNRDFKQHASIVQSCILYWLYILNFNFNPKLIGKPKQWCVDETYKIAFSICGSEEYIAHTFHFEIEYH